MDQSPKVNIDILVLQKNKVLLGLLSKKWSENGKQNYGVPGRDIGFRESIGECTKRNIREELNCEVTCYNIISVNTNYEFGNHYIGIGVTTEIKGEVQLMKPEDWEKWEWFEINNLPENIFAPAKNLIESYVTKK